MLSTRRPLAAACAVAAPLALLLTGVAPAAAAPSVPGVAPWAAPTATVVIDPGLGARAATAARVFGYIDDSIGVVTQLRFRPVGGYLTAGAAADHVQTVRIGDPGMGHLAFTMRYVTPAGVVHTDTIVRPGLPSVGPGSFTRVLAHEAEMSVGVGECADPGAVCYWTFGTAVPRLNATDRARLAAVRAHIEHR